MAGSTANTLTNPAVSASGEVDSLLIERFTGQVHEMYLKGENILSHFEVQEVTGTNMVSNKYIGGTTIQRLVAGQEPEATPTSFDKNALVVDTVLLARNTVAMLHDIQSDIKVSGRLASNQAGKLKESEDEMVIQQLVAGAQTGGTFDGIKVTGGIRRLPEHGAAVKVNVKAGDMEDPYHLAAALDIALNGLIAQKTPIGSLKVIMPINEFSVLCDYGYIDAQGISASVEGMQMTSMMGRLKSYGVTVYGSQMFTQMLAQAPHDATTHSLLSNADNGYRYDVTADIQKSRAVVFGRDALLCGRTIALQGDIFFDKKTKTYFIDSWFSEGCIPDRYDNMATVMLASATDANVKVKAKGKSLATRAFASA